MKPLRWLVSFAGLLLVVIAVLLLLNFTAANPTGRRYSSEMPHIGQQYTINDVGADAERILAHDLGLPNNNDAGQRQCVCGQQYSSAIPAQCSSCLANSGQIANYRIPDFVGPGYIAESKNSAELTLGQDRNFSQIRDIAAAARETGLAFWLYVRVDTRLDPAYSVLFDGLKGGIVPYFTGGRYVDPVDQLARIALLIGLALLIFALLWALWDRISSPGTPRPAEPRPRKAAPDPLRKADEATDFARRMKDRARQHIDDTTNGNH